MHHSASSRQVEILGLSFSTLSAEELISELPSGGLLVAPAAPALASMADDPSYCEALASAKWILPDSGYMVLLWNMCHRKKLKRCSGLKLFSTFISQQSSGENSKLLCINPSVNQSRNNKQWLTDQGIEADRCTHYEAPLYTMRPITDPPLLELIESEKPQFLLLVFFGISQRGLFHGLHRRCLPGRIRCENEQFGRRA